MLNVLHEIRRQYTGRDDAQRYNILSPSNWQMYFERQRATLELFAEIGVRDVSSLVLVDVGAGAGNNLIELIRYGFDPAKLTGIELLEDRIAEARERLPGPVTLLPGDASAAPIAPASVDIVYQSVVFSSLLDNVFQQSLADMMWRWLKPGGAVLWYDFVYNNPRNRDVRGVPLRRVRQLFPRGVVTRKRVTLAPPIARVAVAVHPRLYGWLNWPILRTHALCWIEKPRYPIATAAPAVGSNHSESRERA